MEKHHDHINRETVETKFSDFTPLIIIFTLILFLTWILVSRLGSFDIVSVLRNFMAVFFLVFGSFKLINLKGFKDAYGVYDVIAMRFGLYGYIYPFIEIGLGLAYLFSFKLFITNWITLVVMLVDAYGVYLKLRQKEVVPCACLGVVFKIPMTWVTFGEDLLMALMALGMIILI